MRCGLADPLDWRVRNLLRSRSRVNSAIYISPIYQDAHIRNGISVRPIRKAQSADFLPKYDYSGWTNYQQFSLPLTSGGGGGVCAGGGICAAGGVCPGSGACTGSGICAGGGVCTSAVDSTVHQQHIKRFQLPTVSISIASDSDKALNELLI
ncbi:Fibronectin type-III domain-containing protein [Aphis craccivora]|uniref:Fibronectin type-III domain-containing protein n=1 Tax=Aphis craccivora TaxID=307492 RepID=A0A6G0YWC6_APHCR|nr:Fibronectin type-III domain-containing protein [Aphis craccivora]